MWQDAQGSRAILNWIRSGGAAKANEALAIEARQAARIREGKVIGSCGPASEYDLSGSGRGEEFGFISVGLSMIFDLFSGGGFD